MSAFSHTDWTVVCDREGCVASLRTDLLEGMDPNVMDVRRILKREGWTVDVVPPRKIGDRRVRHLDFCPDHKPRTCAACGLGGDLVEIKPGTWACADFVACHKRTEEGA